MKCIIDNNTAKLPIATVRHYWKYQYSDEYTPEFTSQAQATAGIDGYKMLTSANKYAITGNSTVTSSQGTVFTFDLGQTCTTVKRLDYVSTYSWNQWLWMTLSNLQGSVNGTDWTLIASRAGSGREGDYQNNIAITDGNSFRYIRFTAYTDSTGWAGGAKQLKFLYTKRTVVAGTEQDYDFYTDDNTYFGINQ